MIGPYRVRGFVEPDPLLRCDGRESAPVCFGHPSRHALPTAFLKAVSAAATLFLLVASASVAAIATSVVRHRTHHASRAVPQTRSLPTMLPRVAHDSLGSLGSDTHAIDELWRRAEERASHGADVTLVRAALPQARAASFEDGSAVRVVHDARARGLRIVDLGESSPATLAGLQRGDVITAVNGFAISTPDDAGRAFDAVRAARGAVAEMWRGGRRVVLRVDLGS